MQKPECLDFEAMLKAIIERHTAAILATFQYMLQTGPARTVFGAPGVVTRINECGLVPPIFPATYILIPLSSWLTCSSHSLVRR